MEAEYLANMAKCAITVDQTSTTSILKFGADHESSGTSPWHSFLSEDETVVEVTCGYKHSALLCASGNVYVFGSRFIRGSDEEPKTENAVVVDFDEDTRIVDIACGRDSAFFVAESGALFACGINHRGQLGVGSTEDSYFPVEVTDLPPVAKVSAGMCQAVALSKDGDVYESGHSLLKSDGTSGNRLVFVRLSRSGIRFVDVSCGCFHYAVLSDRGSVYVVGNNSVGELGSGDDIERRNLMTDESLGPVDIPTKVSAIACGSFHTLALTIDGIVWAWGFNARGQLGVGDWSNRGTPTRVIGLEGVTVTRIIAGGHHSFVLTADGDVFACGRGRDGELVRGSEDTCAMTRVMRLLPPYSVRSLSCAWSYTVVLLDSKRVNEAESCLLASMRCPECCRVMRAPIHQCTSGHVLCDDCRTCDVRCTSCDGTFSGARNYALESLREKVQLPCPACFQRMPLHDLSTHEDVCPKRIGAYERNVRPRNMFEQVSAVLRQDSWKRLPHLFVHKINGHIETNVLSAHNELFVLRRMFDTATQTFMAVLQFVGLFEDAKRFKFALEFVTPNDDRSYAFRKDVCSDVDSIENSFKSDKCVSLDRESFGRFFIDDLLVCKVDVLKTEGCRRVDNIRALVEREQRV